MPISKLPIIRTIHAYFREIVRARAVTADVRSFFRLATDLVLFRFLRLGSLGMLNRERTIRLYNSISVIYRLNRGDIQSIREVWLEDIYRMASRPRFPVVVDLGANIGQASVYFARKYEVGRVVAVEPNPQNALLARRNLEANRVLAQVIEAAAGPMDGTAYFEDGVDSNNGHLSDQGREVNVLSIPTLCRQTGVESIDLLKMDIEGGEQALLMSRTGWLDRVQTIIAEFHPDQVDYAALVNAVIASGFARTTPEHFHAEATEMFTRIPSVIRIA